MFDPSSFRPMLATLPNREPPLTDPTLVYEPKYDGIRAIVLVAPADGTPARVELWSRLGNEKTRQFPEIVAALQTWARELREPLVLDGEIVALDRSGRPAGFQRLQNRIHVVTPTYRSDKPQLSVEEQPTALMVFDILAQGALDLRARPLTERRAHLEALFAKHPPPKRQVRVSEQVAGDGRPLMARAHEEGWEGLLVKLAAGPYRTGRRSPEWQKLKLVQQDEFVVGGWTEPNGTRARFGSLVLGVYRGHDLVHVGDVGTGFSVNELERMWKLLAPLATASCPFVKRPKTLGRPHWVRPELVVQVRYGEWTDDGRLRHPAYLGQRTDKRPQDVHGPDRAAALPARAVLAGRTPLKPREGRPATDGLESVLVQLATLEQGRKNGKIILPDGATLDVSNLHKVFWPEPPFTKGDLLRYYTRVSPYLLPVLADRPLVMKRMPNGVRGASFYQHRAPEPVPDGVRIATLPNDDVPARLIGGSLKTLLYMAQLASISMDPWFSRVDAGDHADQVAIDLDPQPNTPFSTILEVARWVHEELERLGVVGYPKTSGSEGLHIFIPLRPGTTYEAGRVFCQIVATLVSTKHPKVATVERAVGKRKHGTVYVDYLQNIEGKTLACAYSARASSFGGVSAPLTWDEVYADPKPQDFTIANMLDRIAAVGDLWEAFRKDRGANLARAVEKLK